MARTKSHVYPPKELDAMLNFYGGKRCVISRRLTNVEWAHIMDAALDPSNMRLSEMLTRKLREDRNPQNFAGDLRENIVPLNVDHHMSMDACLTKSTLFLHEDILARTLEYEQDLRDWRIAELNAGRTDPGRPEYREVFGGASITQHRYHSKNKLDPFIRKVGSDEDQEFHFYLDVDCPGIDRPDSQNNFPIIDTLLSIPFSLLHTLPRLAAIFPPSTYQQQLIAMGFEVVSLWWWDPPPELIAKSEESRRQNVDANQQDDTRKPRPYPIHHPSRSATTFETKKTIITYSIPSTPLSGRSPNQDAHVSSGQIFLGRMPSLSRDKDGLLILGNDQLGEMEDMQCADKFGVTGSPMISEIWDIQTPDRIEGFDDIDEDVEEKPAFCRSSSDIMSWYEKVVEASVEHLPLLSSPYERGIIGGSSTNEVLMVKGLIDPRVYMQFLDLSRFSCI